MDRFGLKIQHCSEWTIKIPTSGTSVLSPEFIIDNYRCFLEFTCFCLNFEASSPCRAYSLLLTPHYLLEKWNISVKVKNSAQQIFTLTTNEEPFYNPSEQYVNLWTCTEGLVRKYIPSFYFEDSLTFLLTVDRIVQPDELPDESVQVPLSFSPLHFEGLSEDFTRQFTGDVLEPDVIMICGGNVLKAHKIVLSKRSTFFATVFNNDRFKEETGRYIVNEMDVDFEILKQFVQYLYCGILPYLTVQTAKQLYEVGVRYAVESLAKQCANFLLLGLQPDTACDILVLAHRHGDCDFKERVIAYILEKEIAFSDSSYWQTFCNAHPGLALQVLNRVAEHLQASMPTLSISSDK